MDVLVTLDEMEILEEMEGLVLLVCTCYVNALKQTYPACLG